MVGDRIDNDVVPGKLLGMRTVLFRTGRHRGQQPRSWEEERPDAEVHDVAGLTFAIDLLRRRPYRTVTWAT
jgi:ribonucleotide monophosphatase NagD (HAD superfamily)